MAAFLQSVRSGFGRQSNKGNGNGNGTAANAQQRSNGSASSSPTAYAPSSSQVTTSPYSQPTTTGSDYGLNDAETEPEPPKFFFREKYAKLGVKGSFMPLAVRPIYVDMGDWLAHHCHEQYRVLERVLVCIQETDTTTGLPLCNSLNCSVMSAGRAHTYTWLNHKKEPVRVSAPQYTSMVQRWICGKLCDTRVFPTDTLTHAPSEYASGGLNTPHANMPIAAGPTTSTLPLSTLAGHDWVGKGTGFPENFITDCKTIFRQMFRLYAHIYHSHFIEPFWHIQVGGNQPSSGWTDLNSCFVHFINVSMLFGLLSDRDMEPMQPLIDIWIANGAIPAEAASKSCAIEQ